MLIVRVLTSCSLCLWRASLPHLNANIVGHVNVFGGHSNKYHLVGTHKYGCACYINMLNFLSEFPILTRKLTKIFRGLPFRTRFI
jgi:hypothetical protein